MKQLSFLLLIATLLSTTHAFLQTGSTISSASGCSRSRAVSGALFSTVADEEAAVKKNDELLKRDRYVATNRFTVRQGRAAKFEKRWADRSSRLAELDGFKYFQLMRRVGLDNEANSGIDPLASTNPFGNYVSFTIWQEKKHFNAWRGGEAFKEAHGGTSLFAFVKTMVSSAMVLTGAPKPAFYDGLLQQSTIPSQVPETVNGWRSVEADGESLLPAEAFIACNQFFVPPSNAVAFEQRWANRASKLKECDGFVSFSMLRRDVKAKGHGISPMGEEEPTHVSTTIWKDRQAFENWKNGNAFKEAHVEKKGQEEPTTEQPQKQQQPPAPLWTKPPVPVFYESTLVISSPEGA